MSQLSEEYQVIIIAKKDGPAGHIWPLVIYDLTTLRTKKAPLRSMLDNAM